MKPLEYPINTEIYNYLPYYSEWRPHEESNLDLRFRKPLFYPLNYGGGRQIIIRNTQKITSPR